MNIHQLAPDEPLSPELVLVFSPELRAQVLSSLPAPIRPKPRPPALEVPASAVDDGSIGKLLAARIGQLALVFVAVTSLVLAMSLVAQAVRSGPQARPINKAGQPGRSGRSDLPVRRYRREVWKPA